MKLKKIKNEYYLLADITLVAGDYYVDENNAIETFRRGNNWVHSKILASSYTELELPLINVMQVERLLDEYILNPVRKVLSTDLRLSDKDLDNIMFGYKLGNQKNNIKEAINWIDTLMGKDVAKIPDVHLQTFKTFLLSLSGEETEWGVVVEGKEVFAHSKKWNKSVGETHPTIYNGFVTIKSIYKL
jgi:hypothetical protein